MAVLKCKMCGGDLNFIEGASTAQCEFCGSVQTVPKVDDEKKLIQFERAERLRKQCEFDKAAGIYESIIADFRQESEAYWGLVLCKYGIEYVDDPATGKKIPTCHRSSFDSILEDSDFDQAMENADSAAQKVYREEAKKFERIRKGILEVSSAEKPYDIFICYKETDENGDRTLDSVLAQDLYSALTDKGYRVFFSRITLQGKLGEAYEPYIFAALNSAKVMLAVGTCYEYYNAVWVKNEWSRYIKLCQESKEKHLIPCYKDLDPEDMPKEFNHLQGADLGKMGAVQDILFNMEKYIPLKKETVVQEKVVVGGTEGNKIAALLDRGNMALEDGDWAKADSFFEDVLNNDSKNAQAYLGKTLAQEKCRTIDAFIRKRMDAANIDGHTRGYVPEESEHIAEAMRKYAVPGYVSQEDIEKLYTFDLGYSTQLPLYLKKYADEEAYWNNHKLLSRAEKFASGAVLENLKREKNALFATLDERVKKAEAADAAAKKVIQEQYAQHIQKADKEAKTLYNKNVEQRDSDYRLLLHTAKTSESIERLTEAAEKFQRMGDYQDSVEMGTLCRKRIEEETAKAQALLEQQRIEAEKARQLQAQQRAAKIKKTIIIGSAVAAVLITAIVLWNTVISPSINYTSAEKQMVNGQYYSAAASYELLGDYRDSKEKALEAKYAYAEKCFTEENYSAAIGAFQSLGNYKDSAARVREAENAVRYDAAKVYLTEGSYDNAINIFESLGTFKDSQEQKKEASYCKAISMLREWTEDDNPESYYNDIDEARDILMELGDYKDAQEIVNNDFVYQSRGAVHYKEDSDYELYKTATTYNLYDKYGRLIVENNTTYTYNDKGQVVRKVINNSNGEHIYDYEYNDLGQNTVKRVQSGENVEIYTYTYNAQGDEASYTYKSDLLDYKMTYRYTYQNGKKTKCLTYDEDNELTYTNQYTYDEKGNLTEHYWVFHNGGGTSDMRELHEYTYDENGNCISYVRNYDDAYDQWNDVVDFYRERSETKYSWGYVWAPDANE